MTLKSNAGDRKVCKKKNLSWLFGTDRKIRPSGSLFGITRQSLVMPNSDTRRDCSVRTSDSWWIWSRGRAAIPWKAFCGGSRNAFSFWLFIENQVSSNWIFIPMFFSWLYTARDRCRQSFVGKTLMFCKTFCHFGHVVHYMTFHHFPYIYVYLPIVNVYKHKADLSINFEQTWEAAIPRCLYRSSFSQFSLFWRRFQWAFTIYHI